MTCAPTIQNETTNHERIDFRHNGGTPLEIIPQGHTLVWTFRSVLKCSLTDEHYATKTKVSDEQMRSLDYLNHPTCPQWNAQAAAAQAKISRMLVVGERDEWGLDMRVELA